MHGHVAVFKANCVAGHLIELERNSAQLTDRAFGRAVEKSIVQLPRSSIGPSGRAGENPFRTVALMRDSKMSAPNMLVLATSVSLRRRALLIAAAVTLGLSGFAVLTATPPHASE